MEHYKLPNLPYDYSALAPYMSEEVLRLHHDKHHASYVTAANALLDKLEDGRKNNSDLDFKSVLKSLSFNVAGHILHETFWKIMVSPAEALVKTGKASEIMDQINKDFGGIERFKKEFSQTALSVEGSGWALLTYHKDHGNLNIIQVEKHNVNFYPEQRILLCLDVWEHSYYLDYKNDRAKFIENWWNIVNWEEVNKRFVN
ncbi:MAG: superoxide dismutase [Candidatus Staskawiczbacteria bacterium]|nr:superoxide dismutase [Candidatus Staskawiczbacteria bacterium]